MKHNCNNCDHSNSNNDMGITDAPTKLLAIYFVQRHGKKCFNESNGLTLNEICMCA